MFAANTTGAGVSGTWSGTNVWVWAGPVPHIYTVSASVANLSSCNDTFTVQVLKIDIQQTKLVTN